MTDPAPGSENITEPPNFFHPVPLRGDRSAPVLSGRCRIRQAGHL